MTKPPIRKARLADAESLAALCTELGYPSTGAEVRRAHGFYLRAGYSLSKTSHLFAKVLG